MTKIIAFRADIFVADDISLRNHVRNHFAMDIRQSIIASLEAVRQLFVIESQQMQNCGLQVVGSDLVFQTPKPSSSVWP